MRVNEEAQGSRCSGKAIKRYKIQGSRFKICGSGYRECKNVILLGERENKILKLRGLRLLPGPP
jgi:hypothetical protein